MSNLQDAPTERTRLLGHVQDDGREHGAAASVRDESEISESERDAVGAQSTDPSHSFATPPRLRSVFAGLALPIFLGTFDRYIVNTNYVQIATEFEALELASWISTSFFLAVACAQPLWGKLSDIFGRKTCLMTAYTLFAIGGLGCGMSSSMIMFVGSRIVQGLGAGGTSILTTITLNDLVSDRDRGIWQGYVNLLTSAGSSLGAPMGGIFADQIGWRWAFYLQVPIIALALINVHVLLQLPPKEGNQWRERLKRLDILGAVLLTGSIFCLLFGIDRGTQVSFRETISFIPLAVCPVLVGILVWNESRLNEDRFIPPWSTMNRSVLSVYAVNLFSYGAFSSIQFWVPLFYQAFDGVSPTQTGIRMLPATVATVAGNLVGGRVLKKTGYYRGLITGGQIAAAAGIIVVILGTIFTDHDILIISIGSFVACFSFGMGLSGTLLALICNIDRTHQGVLMACMWTLRSLGSASTISLSGTAIQTYFRQALRTRLPADADTDALIRKVAKDLRAIDGLPTNIQQVVRASYGESVRLGFIILTFLFVIALLSSFGIKSGRISK